MKVVIAIDSLKGSLSSVEAGYTIKDAITKVHPSASVVVKPLADGGEGTTDSLIEGLGGERIDVTVCGPLGRPIDTYYGYLSTSQTAIMEMAGAAGITLMSEAEKNPLRATTYGVGEMIRHAMDLGARTFIIGIGGSATNDGGIGMLKALGYAFLDDQGKDVGEGAQALRKVAAIKADNVDTRLSDCTFRIACDVNNPLCGENGATYIYGPQKGVTPEQKSVIDQDMRHYAHVTEEAFSCSHIDTPGAGAAGGLGFAFLCYLNGHLQPGIDLVLDAISLEAAVRDADIVVTGEGRLDNQTAMGKAPIGVAKLGKKYNAKVIAFAGSVTKDAIACNDAGIDAYFPILRQICTLEEAMRPENARQNLFDTAEQVFRLL